MLISFGHLFLSPCGFVTFWVPSSPFPTVPEECMFKRKTMAIISLMRNSPPPIPSFLEFLACDISWTYTSSFLLFSMNFLCLCNRPPCKSVYSLTPPFQAPMPSPAGAILFQVCSWILKHCFSVEFLLLACWCLSAPFALLQWELPVSSLLPALHPPGLWTPSLPHDFFTHSAPDQDRLWQRSRWWERVVFFKCRKMKSSPCSLTDWCRLTPVPSCSTPLGNRSAALITAHRKHLHLGPCGSPKVYYSLRLEGQV